MLLLAEATLSKAPLRDPVAEVVHCPKPRPGEISICGKREADPPYRLPQQFRDEGFRIDGPVDSVSRERHLIMDVGGAGAQQNACSAVGMAGWTGCEVKGWKEADQQRGYRRPVGVRIGK